MMLVYADHDRGVIEPLTFQALTFARDIDPDIHAVLIGGSSAGLNPSTAAAELGEYGAQVVDIAELCGYADYAPLAAARALVELLGSTGAQALIAPSSPRGNEVLAHVAAFTDRPFVADCYSIALGAPHKIVRARWAGNLHEELDVSAKAADVLIATVFPHSTEATTAPADGAITEFTAAASQDDLAVQIINRVGAATGGVTLPEAKVIVSGGRGMGGPDGFGILEDIAAALGGTVGCTRVVTSAGWRPHSEQVGQTGTKVAPDLYLACGISGATQHLAGCKNSKTLVAINTDPDATIMNHADYIIVGDVNQVLPMVLQEIHAAKS
jgi:electron transfer flavoprotein alpha subunit